MKPDYKKIEVDIKGLSPLLMNRLNKEDLRSKTRRKTKTYSTEEDAKKSTYMTEIKGKEQLYIPNGCVHSMMIGTAKAYRLKRMSMASILAGTMRIEPEKILLGTNKYEIDERAVVIQRQRVLKGRAKLPEWAAKFFIVYDANRLPEDVPKTLLEILEDAGTRMGLLDYRPQHKGWFGTFNVEHFRFDGVDLCEKPETPKETEAQ